MPEYLFARADDESVTSLLFYKMAEAPAVGSQVIDDQGVAWRRVFTTPQAAKSITSDPYSQSDFRARTEGKNLTMGNLFDASREASERRAAKEGVDPVKQTYLKDYAKARKGTEHSVAKRERFEARQKELGIKLKV